MSSFQNFSIYLFIVSVHTCMCVGTLIMACEWRSKGNSVLYHGISRYWTQVIRLGSTQMYLLSHLRYPILFKGSPLHVHTMFSLVFGFMFFLFVCFKMTWHEQSYCAQAGLSFSGSTHPPVLGPQGADISGMFPSTCHIPCFLYPFICPRTFGVFLYLGYCECHSNKHRSTVNPSIPLLQILVLKLIFRGGIPWCMAFLMFWRDCHTAFLHGGNSVYAYW